jgi:hypothetical protein
MDDLGLPGPVKKNSGCWDAGRSGNPRGRPPKERAFSDTARELLNANEIDIEWKVGLKTRKLKLKATKNLYYGIAAAMIHEALNGDVRAAHELLDRVDGKVEGKMTLQGGETPFTIVRLPAESPEGAPVDYSKLEPFIQKPAGVSHVA